MSRLPKNIIYNLFGQGLILVLGFVAVKYIFKQLGEDALGIIYFTATLNIVLTGILQKSVYSTVVREVSGHFKDDAEYIRDLIRTGSLFCWSVYAFFAVVVYFVTPVLVGKWINLKTMDATTAIGALRILAMSSLVAFPSSFYASLFHGLQRMEFNNLIDVTTTGLQHFGTILILKLGGNFFDVVYWFAACYGLNVFVYVIICTHFFPLRAFIPSYSSSVIKRNLSFISKMFSISILATIEKQTDKIILSKLLPIGLLGYYGFAYGVVSRASLIPGAICRAAFPSFSALIKSNDYRSLNSQYKRLHDLICFFTIPIFIAIPFAASPLFTYLFNAGVANLLLLPVALLSLGSYLNGTLNLPYQLALAAGKPEIIVRSSMYALIIVTPITIFLVYFLKLTGAGLSWVFFNILVYAYAIPKTYRECLRISSWGVFSKMFKIFVITILTYGTAWTTLTLLGSFSISSLILSYTVSTTCFLTMSYFSLSDELRATLIKYVQISSNKLKSKAPATLSMVDTLHYE